MSESARKYASAAAPPIASDVEPSCGSFRSRAIRQRGTRKLRAAALTTIGREIARRALAAGAASISFVTRGRVTLTGSIVAPGVRSSCPSERTMVSAAASRSSRVPVSSGTTSMRRPWRTSLALLGERSTSSAIWSRAYSSAAFETVSRGRTSAPKTRARSRRKPRSGPNPSPARPAAATAALQSGWTPSWFAAKRYVSPPATNAAGSAERCSNSVSSFATASRLVRPPTSTPATSVPAASSFREPANARPTRTASTTATPPAAAIVLGVVSARRRRRLAVRREGNRHARKREF